MSEKIRVGDPPTARQLEVLGAIVSLTLDGLRPPLYRELMDRMGWSSPNAVTFHIRSLVAKGLLVETGGLVRCLRLSGCDAELRAAMAGVLNARLAEIASMGKRAALVA